MNSEETTIFFITGNVNKFNEVFKAFQEEKLKYSLKQLDLDPLENQSETVHEVALFKLKNIKLINLV